MPSNDTTSRDPQRHLRIPGVRVLSMPDPGTRERMRLNYATIERLAGRLNGLREEETGLLHGRMRHFTKADFPVPLGRGRGVKSGVGMEDALRLLYAFQLLDVGLPPGHAMRLLREDWDDIRRTLAYAWTRVADGATDADGRRLLVIEPHLLVDLRGEGRRGAEPDGAAETGDDGEARDEHRDDDGDDHDGDDGDDDARGLVGVMSPGSIAERLSADDQPRHCLVLDAERFMRGVAELLVEHRVAGAPEVRDEMRLFCVDAFGGADERRWRLPDAGQRARHAHA